MKNYFFISISLIFVLALLSCNGVKRETLLNEEMVIHTLNDEIILRNVRLYDFRGKTYFLSAYPVAAKPLKDNESVKLDLRCLETNLSRAILGSPRGNQNKAQFSEMFLGSKPDHVDAISWQILEENISYDDLLNQHFKNLIVTFDVACEQKLNDLN